MVWHVRVEGGDEGSVETEMTFLALLARASCVIS